MKIINSSCLVVDPAETELKVEYVGTPIKVGIVLDLVDDSRDLKIVCTATTPGTQVEIRILCKLSNSNLALIGDLTVLQGAIGARLFLTHTTVLTDNKSTVTSIPKLTILQDQVQCGHGATISRPDDMALEYLSARGFTRQKAQTMLYSAKYQSLCEWVLTK